MASKMRANARRLGLRYQGDQGKLKFERNGPTHKLWWGVLHGTKPRRGGAAKPFEELIPMIDEYGPQVWTSSNRELFQPGIHKEYPVALQWPDDRDKIIRTFRQMYDQREPVQITHEEFYGLKPLPSIETPETPGRQKPWRSGPARSKPEVGATCEIEDLFLTNLWMTTPDRQYSAEIKLGSHQTIPKLFTAIENAFFANSGLVDARAVLGGLQKVIIEFTKLGPNLRAPQLLSKSDSNQKLRILRFNIYQGYEKYREDEDGEVIIGRTTAIFEQSNSGEA